MRTVFLSLLLALASLLHAAPSVPTSAEPVIIPNIVLQWVEAQQHMGDIAVDFRLTRSLPTLKEPITADGRFWKQADGQFRWEMGSPPSTVLIFDNKDLHVWENEKQTWEKLSPNSGGMRMWMQFLNSKEMNAEAMGKTFIPTVTGEAEGVTTVALQPKGLIVRKYLKQVDLQIDPKTKYLRQIRILQNDDASVIMTFAAPHPMNEADKAKLHIPAPSTK